MNRDNLRLSAFYRTLDPRKKKSSGFSRGNNRLRLPSAIKDYGPIILSDRKINSSIRDIDSSDVNGPLSQCQVDCGCYG